MEKLTPGLYVVATPLGNLGDMTQRAHDVLSSVDVIACEDTREMKKLMSLIGIERGTRDVISVHDHNEHERANDIIELIQNGSSVVYASDAGMPAISDPGAILVDRAHDAELFVTCIPGATAVTTALSVSGFTFPSFTFVGFFPREAKGKSALVKSIAASTETIVFYESPKRLGATLAYLSDALDENNRAVVCRELTKKFEEIKRGTLGELSKHFQGDVKGECVVVVEGQKLTDDVVENEVDIANSMEVLHNAGISSRDAVDALSGLTRIPKNRLKQMYAEIRET